MVLGNQVFRILSASVVLAAIFAPPSAAQGIRERARETTADLTTIWRQMQAMEDAIDRGDVAGAVEHARNSPPSGNRLLHHLFGAGTRRPRAGETGSYQAAGGAGAYQSADGTIYSGAAGGVKTDRGSAAGATAGKTYANEQGGTTHESKQAFAATKTSKGKRWPARGRDRPRATAKATQRTRPS